MSDTIVSIEEIRTGHGHWINVQEPVREAFCQLFSLCKHQSEQIEQLRVALDEAQNRSQASISESRARTTSELLKAIGDTTSAVRRDVTHQVSSTRADLEAVMKERLKELGGELSTKLSTAQENNASRFKSLETLFEARLSAQAEAVEVRSKAAMDYAEGRVKGVQDLMDSRTSSVLQQVEAKVEGLQEMLAAQIATTMPKVKDEVISEVQYTIVHDWQSLNIKEHKEEVRREISRQMQSVRSDQEKRLKDLRASMNGTLDEVTKRALSGTSGGPSRSAVSDIIHKIRELEQFTTTELDRLRHDLCKGLRDKLDASMIDEYTARVASLFERMGSTLNADSIGQLHTHATRVNQELRSHERRMELQLADLEATRKELHDALSLLREHQARIEESANKALDYCSEAKVSSVRLASQVAQLHSDLYGPPAPEEGSGCTCGEEEDEATHSTRTFLPSAVTGSFVRAVASQPSSPARTQHNAQPSGSAADPSSSSRGLLGRLDALSSQVAACATWAEVRDVGRRVDEVREEACAAVKELLVEIARSREDSEVAGRALKMEVTSRLLERAPLEALRTLESRVTTMEGDLSSRLLATREQGAATASRVAELERASEERLEALKDRVGEVERGVMAEASHRKQFEAHVEGSLSDVRKQSMARVEEVAAESSEQTARLLEESIKRMNEVWAAARSRDANVLRDQLEELRLLFDQKVATSRTEAENAVQQTSSRVKSELEDRIRLVASEMQHLAPLSELRRQVDMVLEVTARNHAGNAATGRDPASREELEALKKDVFKLEDRATSLELKSERFVGRLENVEKVIGGTPKIEDIQFAIRTAVEGVRKL